MSHDQPLAGLRFLMFVGDEYEDLEVWYPKLRLTEAGAHVTMAGLKADTVYKGKHGYPCRSEAAIEMMESSDFHGVILPGGVMPDKLRREQKVKDLIREFAESGFLNIAGGCCGTTPEHIAQIAARVGRYQPRCRHGALFGDLVAA